MCVAFSSANHPFFQKGKQKLGGGWGQSIDYGFGRHQLNDQSNYDIRILTF